MNISHPIIGLVDTNEFGEYFEDLVVFLVVAAIVAIVLLVIAVRVFGPMIVRTLVRMMASPAGRQALLVLGAIAAIVSGSVFVFSTLRSSPQAWFILGAVFLIGVPLAWFMIAMLDEDDESKAPGLDDVDEPPHSIWR